MSEGHPSSGSEPRFSVGIDLGTTHCVLSYADLSKVEHHEFSPEVLAIPQLTSPGAVEDKLQLPSFLYQAHDAELAEGSTALPWSQKPAHLVGGIARTLGSKTPIRLIASAKSWLCHAGVDCKSPILPSEAPEEVKRVSPFCRHSCRHGKLWSHRFQHRHQQPCARFSAPPRRSDRLRPES